MKTPRCPCGGKTVAYVDRQTPASAGMVRCGKCGGRFVAAEMLSGNVEGGTYDDRRADKRLIEEESGGPWGRINNRPENLKGGVDHGQRFE